MASCYGLSPLCSDLTESDVVASGIEMLGEYQLHDLVQINQNTAGVIVKIEKDAARVREPGRRWEWAQ